MEKVITVVFNDEKQAYEGVQALRDLHRDGSITLYSDAVVAKDADGKLFVRKAARCRRRRSSGCSLEASSVSWEGQSAWRWAQVPER
jgi:uncharacterized membrane protein